MIVLFDSHCLLCSRTVALILANDRGRSIRFAATTSQVGRDLARRHGLSDKDLDRTFVAIDGDRALLRSDAAIAIARRLTFPFPLLAVVETVPRSIRNSVYDAAARNRYRFFGRRPASCPQMPTGRGSWTSTADPVRRGRHTSLNPPRGRKEDLGAGTTSTPASGYIDMGTRP